MTNEEFQKLVLNKLTHLEDGLHSFDKRQQSFENKLENFENKLENFEDKLQRFDERQQQFEAKLQRFDERQQQFEKGLNNLNEKTQRLEDGQLHLAKRIDTIYEQTAILLEFRSEVNAKLDKIIEDNKSIYEVLGEHEVAIRTLRRRPV